ncbi:MAG: hypothetical protein ACR2NU_11485, partial [Aeoliella sp.]
GSGSAGGGGFGGGGGFWSFTLPARHILVFRFAESCLEGCYRDTIPSMALVIGVDEAGYGPNLGPLVIGLSAWKTGEVRSRGSGVGDAQATVNLYEQLADVVCDSPDGERVAIADSKALYKPGSGLGLLERGVLGTLAAMHDDAPKSWSALVEVTGADPNRRRRKLPWHETGFDPELTVDCADEDVASAARLLKQSSPTASLTAIRARLVFPAEFNELVERFDSKGLALSHVTLELLRDAVAAVPSPPPPTPIRVTCDKHGGRNRYAELLVEHFPEYPIATVCEGRRESRYRFGPDARFDVCFRTQGEEQLETALASMTAKYLRELAMKALNQFWTSHVPGLKPTAGYPVDAKRFKADIEEKRRELEIDDAVLWRKR